MTAGTRPDNTDDQVADDLYSILRNQFDDNAIYSVPFTRTMWVNRFDRWFEVEVRGPLRVGFIPWHQTGGDDAA